MAYGKVANMKYINQVYRQMGATSDVPGINSADCPSFKQLLYQTQRPPVGPPGGHTNMLGWNDNNTSNKYENCLIPQEYIHKLGGRIQINNITTTYYIFVPFLVVKRYGLTPGRYISHGNPVIAGNLMTARRSKGEVYWTQYLNAWEIGPNNNTSWYTHKLTPYPNTDDLKPCVFQYLGVYAQQAIPGICIPGQHFFMYKTVFNLFQKEWSNNNWDNIINL